MTTMMNNYNKKVLLGMSGGIDSSSAAIILQEKGFEVIGVTFIQKSLESMEEAVADAKRIARMLDIEHFVMDLRQAFEQEIVQYFHTEYEKGRTPNPCVKCNKEIKYKRFIEEADRRGIHYISSGQYARVVKENDGYLIKKAKNLSKDQSYYLYNLQGKDLDRVLFPLGELDSKEQARQLLKSKGVEFYQKKESQEICFIQDDKYIEFIEQYFDPKTKLGNFVDSDGNVLGKHEGIHKYTVGQRKGLGIALGTPHYVLDINPDNNNVTLGLSNQLEKSGCYLSDYNIIYDNYDLNGKEFSCKIRYSSRESIARISRVNDKLFVEFKEKVRAVTPGQSLVFYDGDVLIGGGIIDKTV
ncbi:MAG: tRNA 2-thiouridine(34) synthase MnmA [Eubacteriales bacterium]|nr:tRNA 2-thiouridine(34) synthase MnmA [Eubacteriales bacterium]